MFARRGFIAVACLIPLVLVSICWGDSPDGSLVFRTLVSRNESVRFRAIQRLRQDSQYRGRSVDDLIAALHFYAEDSATDEMIKPSVMALINLVADLEKPESEGVLIDLLDAPHVGMSMLSADALGRKKYYGAIDALKKQTGRPEYPSMYAFRFNLVRALRQMDHPDAFEFLAQLQGTLDGQLRYHVDEILEGVTVDDFRGDRERFEQFRNPPPRSNGGSGFFKAANYEPESLQRMRLKPQQYYGIDIHAKRLMFILDHSGSMKDYWGGMTRLERAKSELIRAILELPGEAEFGIVFYHTSVRFWREELLPATEENKRKAIDYVRRLGYGDRTNTYGALRFALEFDDQLEAVFLLTDGKPTIGEIVPKPAIVSDILFRNRFRHLNFNTIGIAVDGSTKAFLQQLAKESGGEFREAL